MPRYKSPYRHKIKINKYLSGGSASTGTQTDSPGVTRLQSLFRGRKARKLASKMKLAKEAQEARRLKRSPFSKKPASTQTQKPTPKPVSKPASTSSTSNSVTYRYLYSPWYYSPYRYKTYKYGYKYTSKYNRLVTKINKFKRILRELKYKMTYTYYPEQILRKIKKNKKKLRFYKNKLRKYLGKKQKRYGSKSKRRRKSKLKKRIKKLERKLSKVLRKRRKR